MLLGRGGIGVGQPAADGQGLFVVGAGGGQIARQAESCVALSNGVTDRNGGLIAQSFPGIKERQDFLDSPEYQPLNELLRRTIARTGVYPRPSGKRSSSAR